MIIKPAVLFLTFVAAVSTLQNPLISSPFDNFRVECAKSSGAVRISVRMVGSQGFIRQDIVFAITCERVDELYPWYGIPTGIVEIEREDCYYSHLFDPVVDTESSYTCRPREYISGITRLSDTRIQVLCCRLRTRDEVNCREAAFTKPIGSDLRTEIYHRNQLINAIAVEGHNYRVRFCDFTPRAIDLIYGDLSATTAITTEIPKNQEEYLASETESSVLNIATARMKTNSKKGRLIFQVATVPSATKDVVQIFRPSSFHSFEEDQNMTNINIVSSDKNDHSQRFLSDIESSPQVQQTPERKLSTVTDSVTENEDQSIDWETDEISNQNSATSTVSSISTSVMQDHSTTGEEVVSYDRNRIKTTTLSYFSSLQTTTSASLILLKPLNSKALYTGIASRNRQPTTKTYTRRRMKQPLSPIISTASFKITPQPTMTSTDLIERNPSKSNDQLQRDSSNVIHIDEETKFSPFENRDNNPARDSEAFESGHLFLTSINPFNMTSSMEDGSSYKFSNQIRRTPIKSSRKEIGAAFKDFPNKQTNMVDHEFNFPSFSDENIDDASADYSDYDFSMKKSADGSRTYVPENHEPLNAPSAIVYDASKENDIAGNAKKKKKKTQQYGQESNQKYKENLSKALLPMNDDEINLVPTDVHGPSSVNSLSIVSMLTFCTKDIAIRDRHNLVIACGSETEIWEPFRCPEGSECFYSTDSSYRICCAVAEAVRYAQ
ncbi:hypothetical protein X798_05684 [Onchocerca flexuosa]|uniref:Zona pellucida-like domain protein n=2 Tax=Onchocerca flexuosa TaxID=387005 RepID=A0A238BRW6_9BILA|nr:hypothetical protein X798_05684 [Onchocerca flexuosa]